MRSVGIELDKYAKKGLLKFHNSRSSSNGLEVHLAIIHKIIMENKPHVVVIDPITNFLSVGDSIETKSMLTRLIDYLKLKEVTAMFTSLTSTQHELEDSEVGVSSLMDAWLLVKNVESNGERNRGLYILKARGIAHSNQVREFVLGSHGVELIDAYIGSEGVLMGSARSSQLARDTAAQVERQLAAQRKQLDLLRKQEIYEAQLLSLKGQYEAERDAILRELDDEKAREKLVDEQRREMARLRKADSPTSVMIGENGARKARKGTVR